MRALGSVLAIVLSACGGAAPISTTTAPTEPSPTPPPPVLAPYSLPAGVGAFDVVARDASVRVYGAVLLDDARVLQRFDLDAEGRPACDAPITLGRAEPGAALALAAAAIGERDLVVLCDQGEDEATHYQAVWVDAEGAAIETVELGRYPAEEGVDAPCFVAVAPSGVDRAIVVHGRDSLACPRVSGDDDVEQCPAFRGVTLAPGAPPEDDFRISTADAQIALVGTARGWAWGLGPYPTRASIVLRYGEIPEREVLLRAESLEGFVATADTIVALVAEPAAVAVFGGAEVPTGAGPNAYDELAAVPAERALSCVDGAVTASVTAGELTVSVRAGAADTSVPWGLFAGEPASSAAAAGGRVYLVDRAEGSLHLLSCASGQPERREVAWFAP